METCIERADYIGCKKITQRIRRTDTIEYWEFFILIQKNAINFHIFTCDFILRIKEEEKQFIVVEK